MILTQPISVRTYFIVSQGCAIVPFVIIFVAWLIGKLLRRYPDLMASELILVWWMRYLEYDERNLMTIIGYDFSPSEDDAS